MDCPTHQIHEIIIVSKSDILGPIDYIKQFWKFGIIWKGHDSKLRFQIQK